MSYRKWQRWEQTGKNTCQPYLQVLPPSWKSALTPFQKCNTERSFKKVSPSCRKCSVFLHYLQISNEVIREEQIKEWEFHSFIYFITIIFPLFSSPTLLIYDSVLPHNSCCNNTLRNYSCTKPFIQKLLKICNPKDAIEAKNMRY